MPEFDGGASWAGAGYWWLDQVTRGGLPVVTWLFGVLHLLIITRHPVRGKQMGGWSTLTKSVQTICSLFSAAAEVKGASMAMMGQRCWHRYVIHCCALCCFFCKTKLLVFACKGVIVQLATLGQFSFTIFAAERC